MSTPTSSSPDSSSSIITASSILTAAAVKSAAFGITGAVLGGCIGGLRRQGAANFAASMGINLALFSGTYFTVQGFMERARNGERSPLNAMAGGAASGLLWGSIYRGPLFGAKSAVIFGALGGAWYLGYEQYVLWKYDEIKEKEDAENRIHQDEQSESSGKPKLKSKYFSLTDAQLPSWFPVRKMSPEETEAHKQRKRDAEDARALIEHELKLKKEKEAAEKNESSQEK